MMHIGLFFSCKKEESKIRSIDHLIGVALEVTNRLEVSSRESDLFGFYISGVRFNSEGTFDLLDEGYGNLDYWKKVGANSDYLWKLEGSKIILSLRGRTEEWAVLEIEKDEMNVSELFEHHIKVSDKQEVN